MITFFPFFGGSVISRKPCEIKTPNMTNIIWSTYIEWIVTNTSEVPA